MIRGTYSVDGAIYSTGMLSCTFLGTKNLTGCCGSDQRQHEMSATPDLQRGRGRHP